MEYKIKKLREKAGLSQSQLAEKAGINFRMLQNYEASGSHHRDFDGAKIKTIAKVCIALNCSLSDIIEDKETIKLLKQLCK